MIRENTIYLVRHGTCTYGPDVDAAHSGPVAGSSSCTPSAGRPDKSTGTNVYLIHGLNHNKQKTHTPTRLNWWHGVSYFKTTLLLIYTALNL